MDQTPASEVIAAFGGVASLAAKLGIPYTTVHHWSRSGVIPAWRRQQVAEAAKREGINLPASRQDAA